MEIADYITFNSDSKRGNLADFSWLLSLEDEVFIQVTRRFGFYVD